MTPMDIAIALWGLWLTVWMYSPGARPSNKQDLIRQRQWGLT